MDPPPINLSPGCPPQFSFKSASGDYQPFKDPWATDSKNTTYGFVKAIDPNIGEYFILFTQGPNKDTRPRLNAASKVIEYSGTGIVVSNLPTKKIN